VPYVHAEDVFLVTRVRIHLPIMSVLVREVTTWQQETTSNSILDGIFFSG